MPRTTARAAPLASLLLAGGAAIVVVVVCALGVPYFPTNDGGQHVVAAHIRNHFSDPGAPYPTYLTPLVPFAEAGFALVYGPLADILPWDVALQGTLVVLGVAWVAGAAFLATGVGPRRHLAVALAGLLYFSWPLRMGFFPFVASTAMGLFVLGLALRDPALPWRRVALLTALVTAAAVMHAAATAFFGLALALVLLVSRPRDAWWRLLPKLALAFAPAALLLASVALHARADGEASLRLLTLAEIPAAAPGFVMPGPRARGWLVLAAAVACGALGCLPPRTREERAVALTGLVLMAAGMVGPLHIPGWQFASPRFVPLGVVLTLASFGTPTAVPPIAAGAAAAALTLLGGLTELRFERSVAAACGDAEAAIRAPLRRRGMGIALFFGGATCNGERRSARDPVPFARPLWGLDPMLAVSHGGLPRFMHLGTPGIHSFDQAEGGPPVPPAPRYYEATELPESYPSRLAPLAFLAGIAASYDSVALVGARDDDTRRLLEWGFRPDFQRGRVLLAHLEPCPMTVTVEGVTPDAPLALRLGVAPSPLPALDVAVEPAVEGGGAPSAARFAVPRCVCGEVWLHALAGATGQPIPLACAGVESRHGTAHVVARAGLTLACRVGSKAPATPSPSP